MKGLKEKFQSAFGCNTQKYKMTIIVLLVIIAILWFFIWKNMGNHTDNWSNNANIWIQSGETNLDTNTQKDMYTYQEWDIVAVIKTTNGTINILLEMEKAPITATNFIGLAKKGYYDGVIFHRIIKGFMIQWWDPDGTGMWGESIYGEKFDDEFHADLSNVSYTISMANAGPNTNGSQFFINTVDNSRGLDGKHAVFGKVVEGFDAVDKLEKVKTDGSDRPEKEVKMIGVEIKEYVWGKLQDYSFDLESTLQEMEEKKQAEMEAKKDKVVASWDAVSVHYTGTFSDGEKFDSSVDRGQPITFTVGAGQMIAWFDAAVVGMKIGDKKFITLEPKDAYGEYSEDNVQVLQKDQLQSFVDAGIELKEGNELPTAMGVFKILKADDTTVTIDVNHPMAGKTLNFDIEIVDIN